MEIFGVPMQAMLGRLLLGLVNGSFYAMLSLGLAVIFGLLNIINFSHGALYMMGAYVAWMGLNNEYVQVGYWWALILAPLIIGAFGIIVERLLLQWLYKLDHLYGLLLTFGLALIIEGVYRQYFGVSGQPYEVPGLLRGATDIGFMILPNYRAWVVLASVASNTTCTDAFPVAVSTREKSTGMVTAPMQAPRSIASRSARSLPSLCTTENQPPAVNRVRRMTPSG